VSETYRDNTWAKGEGWVQLHTHHPDPVRDQRDLEEYIRKDNEYRSEIHAIMDEKGVNWLTAVSQRVMQK
jgi:hypothetical protein